MNQESERGFRGYATGEIESGECSRTSKTLVTPAILEIARLIGALVALEESTMEKGE